MTTWFISRHPGAKEWAKTQGLTVDITIEHLEVDMVKHGDVVIGTLPVHIVADLCKRGARYLHLSMDIPENFRGKELSGDQMTTFGAQLEGYVVLPDTMHP